ncbi:MAG: NUDIX hydrolase [Candidatus Vogelbacteria bacterium]|nr:NUDIX hydrolase [Candidatus Vogelbacteria bacterium]
MAETKPQSVCAGVVIQQIENNPRVLLLQRISGGEEWWTFPGGGQEAGESTERCLAREFQEELGRSAQVMRHLFSRLGRGAKGQLINLHVFLVALVGVGYDVKFNGEHCGFAWMSRQDVANCPHLTEVTRECLKVLVETGVL